MAETQWCAKPRDYERERESRAWRGEHAYTHPLKPTTVTVVESFGRKTGKGSRSSSISSEKSGKSGSTNQSIMDPLSSTLIGGSDPLSRIVSEEMDPLSKMAAQMSVKETSSVKTKARMTEPLREDETFGDTFEPWSAKRAGILSKYTTSEKLSITTSFLSQSDKDKVTVKVETTTVSEKVKNRLEQLDDFEEDNSQTEGLDVKQYVTTLDDLREAIVDAWTAEKKLRALRITIQGSIKEMLNLSQQDYVNRIDELNSALISAWDQDQRVKSLKIAIQCAKLLADVSVIQFYPSKFVLITDILDTFGRLVYDRIRNKSTMSSKGAAKSLPLPENFSPEEVPESAKETCRNWFFKIASIRELIPRFYVEAAVLKCYGFLAASEYKQALLRLACMARGIGDPLVAVYARCFLCRVGIKVDRAIRDHHVPMFDDFLSTYHQIEGDSVQNILAAQRLELSQYLTLYSPALDWLLQCIAHNAGEETLTKVLDMSKKSCNSALLLNSIISAFKAELISARGLEFCNSIRECEETGFPKHLLYRSLGTCLVMAPPPQEQKLQLLNDTWKVVTKLRSPADYISCAEVWLEFVAQHFGKREVNTLLADMMKHMAPDRAFEAHYAQLHSVISKLLIHVHDFAVLFSLEKFMPFIDMFQKDSVKVEVCKTVMQAYCRYQTEPTSDPVILNAAMFICKTMHDSVNALSLDDEIRVIGSLINGFIRSVSFARDFEQQLSFYVEARACFTNIDAVLVNLVQCVNRLAMDTRQIVHGNHSRKTAAFVRACVAYCFITIPSLHSISARLKLYLISGQVALINQCLSQGDAFFKAAISLLAEVPRMWTVDGKMRSTESAVQEYVSELLSVLLVVPDNPDQGVLYLLRGLVNTLQKREWEAAQDHRTAIYMSVLTALCAASQDTYAYHIDRVDSNDVLYGSDPKFLTEVDSMFNTVLEEILAQLKVLEQTQSYKRLATLSHDLFNRLVSHSNLDNERLFSLATRLWVFSEAASELDEKILLRTLKHLKQRSKKKTGGNQYNKLLGNLQIRSHTLRAAFSQL